MATEQPSLPGDDEVNPLQPLDGPEESSSSVDLGFNREGYRDSSGRILRQTESGLEVPVDGDDGMESYATEFGAAAFPSKGKKLEEDEDDSASAVVLGEIDYGPDFHHAPDEVRPFTPEELEGQ